MANYKELLRQRAELEQQIEAARAAELGSALARVRQIIDEFGLTPEQVFPAKKAGGKVGGRPAKFRDPMSGATWSGMGREPLWIKGKPRDGFLIS